MNKMVLLVQDGNMVPTATRLLSPRLQSKVFIHIHVVPVLPTTGNLQTPGNPLGLDKILALFSPCRCYSKPISTGIGTALAPVEPRDCGHGGSNGQE